MPENTLTPTETSPVRVTADFRFHPAHIAAGMRDVETTKAILLAHMPSSAMRPYIIQALLWQVRATAAGISQYIMPDHSVIEQATGLTPVHDIPLAPDRLINNLTPDCWWVVAHAMRLRGGAEVYRSSNTEENIHFWRELAAEGVHPDRRAMRNAEWPAYWEEVNVVWLAQVTGNEGIIRKVYSALVPAPNRYREDTGPRVNDTHFLHVARRDKHGQGVVAYTESVAKGKRDVVTTLRIGKYLRKFVPELTDHEVRDLVEVYTGEYGTAPTLHVARGEDEIIRVINEGCSASCMHDLDYKGHKHPAAIYDTPDIEVLYLTDTGDPDGDVTARTIANAKTKECARIYGDAVRMGMALAAHGYRTAEGALVGCRVKRIPNRRGEGYLMAYVDAGTGSGGGALSYRSDPDNPSEYYLLTAEGDGESTYCGYEYNGLTEADDGCECAECGYGYHSEGLTTTYSGDSVCEGCLGSRYTYAVVGIASSTDRLGTPRSLTNRLVEDYVRDDDTVEMNGVRVYTRVVSQYAEEAGLVELDDGRWASVDDAVETLYSTGMAHVDEALPVGEQAGAPVYATREEIVEYMHQFIVIGTDVVHEDDDRFDGEPVEYDDPRRLSVMYAQAEEAMREAAAEYRKKHRDPEGLEERVLTHLLSNGLAPLQLPPFEYPDEVRALESLFINGLVRRITRAYPVPETSIDVYELTSMLPQLKDRLALLMDAEFSQLIPREERLSGTVVRWRVSDAPAELSREYLASLSDSDRADAQVRNLRRYPEYVRGWACRTLPVGETDTTVQVRSPVETTLMDGTEYVVGDDTLEVGPVVPWRTVPRQDVCSYTAWQIYLRALEVLGVNVSEGVPEWGVRERAEVFGMPSTLHGTHCVRVTVTSGTTILDPWGNTFEVSRDSAARMLAAGVVPVVYPAAEATAEV